MTRAIERELLAYFLNNPQALNNYTFPMEVFAPEHRQAITALRKHFANNEIPTQNSMQLLGVRKDVVSEIFSADPFNDPPVKNYLEGLKLRFANKVIEKLLVKLHRGASTQQEVADNLSLLAKIPEIVARYTTPEDFGETLQESLQQYMETLLENRKNPNPRRIHFPYAQLQEKMPSLKGGTLVSVLADPGVGKTSFLEHCAEYWAYLGFNIVYFNFELSPETMRQRRIQRHTGVSQARQDTPELLTVEELQKIKDAHDRIMKWEGNIQYVYATGFSIDSVKAMTTKLNNRCPWENGRPIDIIILDYLNLINIPNGDEVTGLPNTIQAFKDFCGINGFVGVMAAQFDKASIGKRGRDLSSALGTSTVAHKSNVGIVLDREKNITGEYGSYGSINIVKVNAGETGSIPTKYIGELLKFVPMEHG